MQAWPWGGACSRGHRGQLPQQAEVPDSGLLGVGRHHVPSYREGVLAVDHTDDRGHPLVLVVHGVEG